MSINPTLTLAKPQKERKLTIGSLYLGERKVPAIRLSGNWLTNAGFNFNQKVRVQSSPGQIMICLIEEGSSCE